VASTGEVAHCLNAGGMKRIDYETETMVAFVKGTKPHNKDEAPTYREAQVAHTLNGFDERHNPPAHMVAFSTKLHNTASNQAGKLYEEYTVGLDRNSPPPALLSSAAVRRLTPRECERLQGFPDDYTLIPHRGKPAADGPRYKALGNSMAVPVMHWIGRRLQLALDCESLV
jgi:DNA (cytosine-5)-methyltransferase 1